MTKESLAGEGLMAEGREHGWLGRRLGAARIASAVGQGLPGGAEFGGKDLKDLE